VIFNLIVSFCLHELQNNCFFNTVCIKFCMIVLHDIWLCPKANFTNRMVSIIKSHTKSDQRKVALSECRSYWTTVCFLQKVSDMAEQHKLLRAIWHRWNRVHLTQLSCPGPPKYHHHSTFCPYNYAGMAWGMCVHPLIQYANFPKSPWMCQQQLVFRCKWSDKPLSWGRPLSASQFKVRWGGGYVDSPVEYCTSGPFVANCGQRDLRQIWSTSVSIIPYLFGVEHIRHGTYNNCFARFIDAMSSCRGGIFREQILNTQLSWANGVFCLDQQYDKQQKSCMSAVCEHRGLLNHAFTY